MPATAEPDTPSPRGAGLGLSRLRRNKNAPSVSTGSLAKSSVDSEDNGDDERLKDRTRRSEDDRRPSSGDIPATTARSRLASLVPGRKKRLAKGDVLDVERSGSVRSGDSNQSETSLALDESGHSSLLTDGDDDSDHGKPIRPTLSPHPSHTGYLPLSAPEFSVQAKSVSSIEVADKTDGPSYIPHFVEPEDEERAEPTSSARRSPSPSPVAEKLKGAFSRKKSTGGESDSSKSATAGGSSGLFRPSSRSNSVNTQESSAPEGAEGRIAVTVRPETAKETSLESVKRPETPRQLKGVTTDPFPPPTPPTLLETPKTLVTPPTPTDGNFNAPTLAQRFTSPIKASPPSRSSTSSSVDSIRHRRAQSANIPSKLSTSTAPPLTPTVEETKTPGGTLTQPSNASGFFSSFFSAAQKAADSLSTNIASSGSKSRPGTSQARPQEAAEEVILGGSGLSSENDDAEQRPRAVDTLGKGDLSLSHLGISLSDGPSPMSSTVDLPQQDAQTRSDDATRRAEEEAATRAVSMAYEKPVQSVVSQATGAVRRNLSVSSNDRLTLVGEQTPPPKGGDVHGLTRSGSVRSKISGRRRRHRTSSATAGSTVNSNSIAAALQSSTTGLAHMAAHGSGHRLTGFAVASSKRNKDFHQLFRSVPEDDYLIEDYSAALQRDILLHGRLYVSEGHICFSSNILGWVTNLIMCFDEVVSVEKKSTAVIFPNAIVIQTLQARNTFASFVARDSTYELLIGIWKISHPNLKSSLNGVTLDNAGTGDKTEVADPEGSEVDTVDGSDDEVYDEDEENDVGSFTDAGFVASAAGSEAGDQAVSRKPSVVPLGGPSLANGFALKGPESSDAVAAGAAAAAADFPGPAAHAPTDCTEGGEHYDRPLTDTTISAPLGKVYSMMFGPASGVFMRRWLVEDQKSRELNYVDDKTGLDNDHKMFTFDYIKPLNAPVGPRQTKCITTSTLLSYDLEKAVSIDCSTQTPDVPSGNVFTTKTKYCLMWGPNNSTRLIASCTIEWTGKSWLKGPIEKGANDGQLGYIKNIVTALEAAVTTKPPARAPAKKGKRKGKKEVFDAEEASTQRTAVVTEQKVDWGLFGIFRGPLEPLISLFRPFITSHVIIAVLFVLLVYTWILSPTRPGGGSSGVGMHGRPADRLAAYEEIWRREESELWDWLEARVGLDGIYAPALLRDRKERQKVLNSRTMGRKLEDEKMNKRQMDEAIQVTEERLAALRDAMGRREEGKEEGK